MSPTRRRRSSAPSPTCSPTSGSPGTPPHCRSPPESPAARTACPCSAPASAPHRPTRCAARSRCSMTWRSVSTGPGLIPTTRSPSAGAPLPSARVNAISEALPAAPAIYVGREFLPRRADDVDDHPGPPRLHRRIDHPAERDVAEHLQVPRPPPPLVIDRQQIARRNGAGVVHQDVELARLRRHAAHRGVARQVGGDRPHVDLPPRPDRRGRRIQRRLLARHQDQRCSLRRPAPRPTRGRCPSSRR